MVTKKKARRKRCNNCNRILDRIWFTALMTEEWSWTGEGYNECTAKHSITKDPQENVECPYCGSVVGKGFDFSFGEDQSRDE